LFGAAIRPQKDGGSSGLRRANRTRSLTDSPVGANDRISLRQEGAIEPRAFPRVQFIDLT
jgi:hypothetical protein